MLCYSGNGCARPPALFEHVVVVGCAANAHVTMQKQPRSLCSTSLQKIAPSRSNHNGWFAIFGFDVNDCIDEFCLGLRSSIVCAARWPRSSSTRLSSPASRCFRKVDGVVIFVIVAKINANASNTTPNGVFSFFFI